VALAVVSDDLLDRSGTCSGCYGHARNIAVVEDEAGFR